MNMPTKHLTVLQCGECEPLKASVHASALALAAVMGLYNAAAWLSRRDKHLAINAVLYTVLAVWEQKHVAHHVRVIKRVRDVAATAPPELAPPAAVESQIAA
jgi:hypothetical protein